MSVVDRVGREVISRAWFDIPGAPAPGSEKSSDRDDIRSSMSTRRARPRRDSQRIGAIGAPVVWIYRDDCGCICGAPSVELILSAIAGTAWFDGPSFPH